jgi:type I restriction enzyme, S subunit
VTINWERTKLGTLLDKVIDNRGKTPPLVDDGIELIETTSLTGGGKFPDYSLVRKRVSQKTFDTWFRSGHPRKGDILIATVGANIGSVAMMQEARGCVAQNLVGLRVNVDKINADFLYYYLTWNRTQNELKRLDIGSAQPSIKVPHLLNVGVSQPPLRVQQRIADVLLAYDDLIENYRRRIRILEQMAQMLYREWFVNFRFPGYERLKLVSSPLGLVPESWSVAPLHSLVASVRESVRPGESLTGLRYLPIDCLPRQSLAVSTARPIDEAQSSLLKFCKYDVLFGAMRSYFHKVVIAPFEGVTRSTCFVLRPREEDAYSWMALTLFQEKTVEYSNKHARGSTIPYAVWDGSLGNMLVASPPLHLLSRFNSIVRPMLERIALTFFQQWNLRESRDLLLPKLISGEISIEEVESEAIAQNA